MKIFELEIEWNCLSAFCLPPDVISAVLKSQYYYNLLNGNNVTYDIKYALASALNKLNIMGKTDLDCESVAYISRYENGGRGMDIVCVCT